MKTVKESLNQMGFKKRMEQSLKKEFQAACQNPYFKTLIEKLKMDLNVMMKYTSTLEDCAKECEHCDGCKGLIECRNQIEGYVYLPRVSNDALEFDYHACKYQKKRLYEEAFLSYIETFGVSNDIRNAKMKDIYVDDKKRIPVMKWMNAFIQTYEKNPHQKGLYLHGSFGCGKSYMIAAMFHELAKKKVRSAIVFWPEYLRELKSSMGSDFKQKFTMIKTVPLLLIDDIGAEAVTPWARDEILSTILQYRMQEQLPTFFTSNLTIQELEEHLSITKGSVDIVKARRIMERIKQLTYDTEMISKNLR